MIAPIRHSIGNPTDLIGNELLTSLGLLVANAAVWGHLLALPAKLVA